MTTSHRFVNSPLGPIRLGAESSGRLTEVCIEAGRSPRHGTEPEPEPEGARQLDDDAGDAVGEVLADAAAQLDEYFTGTRTSFDLPLAMEGSSFQRQVWAQLQQIPFGTTVSYAQLAVALGRSGAARAVGHANARNPIPIIVPCHRVIGSSGQLTGYGGGLNAKRLLLDLEARETPSGCDRDAEPRTQSSV